MLGILLWIVVLGALFTAIIAVADRFGLDWVLVEISKKETWWSPVSSLPPPGEAYVIVKGSPNGPFAGLLESVLDHQYEDTNGRHEFRKLNPGEVKRVDVGEPHPILGSGFKNRLDKLGLAWTGLFRYKLIREIVHTKYTRVEDETTSRLVTKTRKEPNIFFRYNMATPVEGVELQGNIVVNAIVMFDADLIDMGKALFLAGGWDKRVYGDIQAIFRSHAKPLSFEGITAEAGDERSVFSQEVERASQAILETIGVKISNAVLVLVNQLEDEANKAMAEALQAEEIAKRRANQKREDAKGEADAKITLAEAEKKRLELEGQGRAAATREVLGALSTATQFGRDVLVSENLAASEVRVLGGNAATLFNIDTESKKSEGGKKSK